MNQDYFQSNDSYAPEAGASAPEGNWASIATDAYKGQTSMGDAAVPSRRSSVPPEIDTSNEPRHPSRRNGEPVGKVLSTGDVYTKEYKWDADERRSEEFETLELTNGDEIVRFFSIDGTVSGNITSGFKLKTKEGTSLVIHNDRSEGLSIKTAEGEAIRMSSNKKYLQITDQSGIPKIFINTDANGITTISYPGKEGKVIKLDASKFKESSLISVSEGSKTELLNPLYAPGRRKN